MLEDKVIKITSNVPNSAKLRVLKKIISMNGNINMKLSGLIAQDIPRNLASPVPPLNLKNIGKNVPDNIKHAKMI